LKSGSGGREEEGEVAAEVAEETVCGGLDSWEEELKEALGDEN